MCSELREILRIDDIIAEVWWHNGYVLIKDKIDYVKKCMDFEVEGVRLKRQAKENLEVKLYKKIARLDKYARKMPRTIGDGES